MSTLQVQPYLTHLNESHRFTSAIVYLMTAEIHAAAAQESDFAKNRLHFVKSLKGLYEEPRTYFLAQLFVGRIASFEVFLQETISIVVQKNPKKVGATEFKLSDILDCTEVSQLIQRATEELLNKLMYKKPSEYLSSICELLSIERAPLDADWLVFVEGKARRDLGMHNAWKCNSIYVRKLSEAGLPSQLKLGDLALPSDDKYILEVDNALDRLAKGITKQVLAKHWPETAKVYESAFDD